MKNCSDSGGAHHFHADEHGVPMCSCGEIEMSPEMQIELVEIKTMPLLPADRARRLYTRMRDLGLDIDVDELVDGVERPEE